MSNAERGVAFSAEGFLCVFLYFFIHFGEFFFLEISQECSTFKSQNFFGKVENNIFSGNFYFDCEDFKK